MNTDTFYQMSDNIAESLIYAAKYGDVNVVKFLVEKCNADVNMLDENHTTPLHIAAIEGNYEVVKYLAEHGADLNTRDIEGYTPLMNATIEGNFEIVRLLILKGATFERDVKEEQPLTPKEMGLYMLIRDAAINGYDDISLFLVHILGNAE